MLNLNLRPRHTTISTILITMFILPIIMLGNDLLMPNQSHGGEDMDTEVVEDTGVVNDAPPRLILCHGGYGYGGRGGYWGRKRRSAEA